MQRYLYAVLPQVERFVSPFQVGPNPTSLLPGAISLAETVLSPF